MLGCRAGIYTTVLQGGACTYVHVLLQALYNGSVNYVDKRDDSCKAETYHNEWHP